MKKRIIYLLVLFYVILGSNYALSCETNKIKEKQGFILAGSFLCKVKTSFTKNYTESIFKRNNQMNATIQKKSLKDSYEKGLNNNQEDLKIITSRNLITPGAKIYLISYIVTKNGQYREIKSSWSIEPKVKGVNVGSDGVLTVKRNRLVKHEESINLVARYKGKEYFKKIVLTKKDPNLLNCKIRYFRYDNDYRGWNIWAWNEGADSRQYEFLENTDLGVLAGIDKDNFIVRYSTRANPWDRKETDNLSVGKCQDIYIIEGDDKVYSDFREAFFASRPKIIEALMDSKNKVVAYLTNKADKNIDFYLYMNSKKLCTVKAEGRRVVFNISKDYNFDPSLLFQIKTSEKFLPSRVNMRKVLDSIYYGGEDLGVTFTKRRIKLRVWAPTATSVSVMLYGSYKTLINKGKKVNLKRDPRGNGTWYTVLPRSQNYGKFYLYRVCFYPGTFYEKINYALDPYAKALSVNGERGALVDIEHDKNTLFPSWQSNKKPVLKKPEDSIIYELHVRDFSIDENSGIKKEYRGKYLAFTQKKTNLSKNKKIKTGIEHLVDLGITHVHLLPVYDFYTINEAKPHLAQFNWGYDPKNYNTPEGSYSTDPFKPKVRVKEFRQMVQSLHDNNIRVVMDVVYNHTYNTSTFDKLVPGYFYRTDAFNHYTNGSGCGNEVASERPMVRKFIVDSVKHWAKNYNIDGFRFDLMGLIDTETMVEVVKELKKINPTIIVYGEPWTGGGSSLPVEYQTWKGKQKGLGFAVFNDNFRNVIRGNNDVPHPSRAYVTGETHLKEGIFKGVMGAINDFAEDPSETINYAAAHDNYVLWDQVWASLGHNFPHPYSPPRNGKIDLNNVLMDSRVKRALLANAIVLTSQGIPFIHAGDEFLRTKYGEHNSYKSSDEINKICWMWKKKYYDLFNYYKGLIKLRKEHPAFRMTSREMINRHFQGLSAPGDVVAYILKNNANKDEWKDIIVIYNPHVYPLKIDIPDGTWNIVVNDKEAGVTPVKSGVNKAKNSVLAPPLSALVMYNGKAINP